MIKVLGIDVPAELVGQWRGWFAPEIQPFPLDGLPYEALAPLRAAAREEHRTPEIRDTFELYGGSWVWLDEAGVAGLPPEPRRALLRLRRPHWPSELRDRGDAPVIAFVQEGLRPSRHSEITPAVWARSAPLLPEARRLAGSFPSGSGPNCFGTVMAAAGVSGAEHEWMLQEPFERWLAAHCEPLTGPQRDSEPGVVLVWRNADGLASHAAVTIGAGHALSKPSQSWHSPRIVWTVRETIAAARQPGTRLSRHRLHTPSL